MNYRYCLLTIIFLLLIFSLSISARDFKQNDFQKSPTLSYTSKNIGGSESSANLLQNDFSIFRKPWRVNTTEQRTFSVLDKDILYRFIVKVYYIDENKFKLWLEPDEPKTKYLFSKATENVYVSNDAGCEAYYFIQDSGDYVYCVHTCNNSSSTCNYGIVGQKEYTILGFPIEAMCPSCSFRQQGYDAYYSTCKQYFGDPCVQGNDKYCGLCYDAIDTTCTGWYSVAAINPKGGWYVNCEYSGKNDSCNICDPVQCNISDFYGNDEYYCNGNDLWKHKKFYDFGCSSNSCNLQSQNYVSDAFMQTCSAGCSNNQCNQVQQCTSGWKCKDASTKAYQNTDCTWNQTTNCSNGCNSGECNPVPVCSKNSDCGTDNWTGTTTCSNNDVYQTYKTWTCNNPGNSNASCSSNTENKLKQDCTSNQNCSNGSCQTLPITCTKNSDCGADGYTGNKFCKNGSAYQQYKTYKCDKAGLPTSSCSNKTEDKVVQDCGSSGCENGGCKIIFAQCTSGVCCDVGKGVFKGANIICEQGGTMVYCKPNDFSHVYTAKQIQYCSGNSNACNGEIGEANETISDTCGANEVCKDNECTYQQNCSEKWECKDAMNKALHKSDCSWQNVTYCPNGCSGGECQPNVPEPDPKATAKALMILACPKDICPNGKPTTHNLGIDWFQDLANQLEDYYLKLSYNKEKLDVVVYPEWVILPDSSNYVGCTIGCSDTKKKKELTDAIDALISAEGINYILEYSFVIVVNPIDSIKNPEKWTYKQSYNAADIQTIALTWTESIEGVYAISMPTLYSLSGDIKIKELRILAHETYHVLSLVKKGYSAEMSKHDDIAAGDYSLMGALPLWPYINYFTTTKPHLDPVNYEFIGYSYATKIGSIPTSIIFLPIDEPPMDDKIANRQKKLSINNSDYYLEYRLTLVPGLEGNQTNALLIWNNSIEDPFSGKTPILTHVFYEGDISNQFGLDKSLYILPSESLFFKILSMDNSSTNVFITQNSQDIVGLNPPIGQQYKVSLNNCLFPNTNYSVQIMNSSGNVITQQIISSDSNGCFADPITWNAQEDPNSEKENYMLALQTADGYTVLKTFSLAHLDGIPKWKPLVSKKKTLPKGQNVSDAIISKLSAALNPFKIALETYKNINPNTYKYEINISAIKEDNKATNPQTEYKLIYSKGKTILLKQDKEYWQEIKSEQLLAMHSGKTIEFYIPKQLLGNPEKVSIKAKTYYQQQCALVCSDPALIDEFPKQQKLEITDLEKPLIQISTENGQYYLGDIVKLKGEGLKSNKTFNIKYVDNLTGFVGWQGTVKSDAEGKINVPTWIINNNETLLGTYKIYWNDVFVGYFNVVKENGWI